MATVLRSLTRVVARRQPPPASSAAASFATRRQIIIRGRLFGLAVITFFSCKLGGRYANYQYERSLFEGFQKSKQEMSTPQL
ncbi:hypothetical protein OsI_24665 [Oryza sativa Indica Group]|uniref:Uncharacterized protein n=1 Tax=Oryza sativa subsp. indica TaxID=39946 RepID=A2YHJ3_ORYSI|nr:hypothetical protein OsI_24665 [Oryza sativa Indica Group]